LKSDQYVAPIELPDVMAETAFNAPQCGHLYTDGDAGIIVVIVWDYYILLNSKLISFGYIIILAHSIFSFLLLMAVYNKSTLKI
jgi:hypothetical protein